LIAKSCGSTPIDLKREREEKRGRGRCVYSFRCVSPFFGDSAGISNNRGKKKGGGGKKKKKEEGVKITGPIPKNENTRKLAHIITFQSF